MSNLKFILTSILPCLLCIHSEADLTVDTSAVYHQRVVSGYYERIIRDTASISWYQIDNAQDWVVADVDAKPPYATIPGSYIDVHSGKFISPPNPKLVSFALGTINSISSLSGQKRPSINYNWVWSEGSSEEEKYSPFISGGTVLMHLSQENTEVSLAHFQPVYLITNQWIPFVEPALHYVQANPTLFRPEFSSDHRSQLENLLSIKNPLIAVAAAQTLGQAHLLDTKFVHSNILNSNGIKASIFTYLVLNQLPVNEDVDLSPDSPLTLEGATGKVSRLIEKETLVKALIEDIQRAKDAETLKDIAIGAFTPLKATTRFANRSTLFTNERVKVILRSVDARQRVLATNTDADVYLDILLKVSGVRETRVTPVQVTAK